MDILPRKIPYTGICAHDVLPQLGFDNTLPDFRVYMLQASNHVYLYEDRHSQTRIIGKFFDNISDRSSETAYHHMYKEFNNLNYLRSIGFSGYPHYVARPLGHNASLDCVLVEEFCYGQPLTAFIIKAIWEGKREPLFSETNCARLFSCDCA